MSYDKHAYALFVVPGQTHEQVHISCAFILNLACERVCILTDIRFRFFSGLVEFSFNLNCLHKSQNKHDFITHSVKLSSAGMVTKSQQS